MSIELNHTIVPSRNQAAAAAELAEMLGVEASKAAHFDVVRVSNRVSLDFMDVDEVPTTPIHLAFLVSEDKFDEVFGRIRERNLPYWADPLRTKAQQTNTLHGGRGVYWDSQDGHNLEILTRSA